MFSSNLPPSPVPHFSYWRDFWRRYGALFMLGLPVIFVLLAYILYPLSQIFIQSLQKNGLFSLVYYREFFDPVHSSNMEALWGSVSISFLSVVFSALVGVPLAYLFTHYEFPGRRLFASVAVLPIVMPPLVGVLAFLFLFGESGMLPRAIQALFGMNAVPFSLQGVPAIVVVHTYSLYVYFYLFCSAFFQDLDMSVIEAAENLGASRFYVLHRVLLPMMTPALGGAALLVFMTSMASFSAPFIFAQGFRILSLEIYNTKLNGDVEMAVAQSVVLTVISIVFLLGLRYYSEKRRYIGGAKGVRLEARPVKKGVQRWLLGGLGILGVILLVLPHVTVVLMSFVKNGTWTWQTLPPQYTLDNYLNLFRDARVFEPIRNSVRMATLATGANVLVGVALAYLMLRKSFLGKKILETVTMLPWAVPGTVVAICVIVTFNKPGILTGGKILVGTFWILPLAYFIRNLPLVFRSTYASLEQFEPALEESARNLGASAWFAFRRVVLPLIAPGILSGTLLAFVLALGEFVSSILLYTYGNRPISVEIVSQLRIFNLGSAAAYSVFLILLIALVVGLSNRYLRTRPGGGIVV